MMATKIEKCVKVRFVGAVETSTMQLADRFSITHAGDLCLYKDGNLMAAYAQGVWEFAYVSQVEDGGK